MRFMVIVRSPDEPEQDFMPDPKLMAEMSRFNEELVKAGVLLAAEGLHPSTKGARVRFDGKKRTVVDGPFAETKELIAGYTLVQVRSREEAMEWSRRFPNPAGAGCAAQIEVRPLYELEDFEPSPALQRMRAMDPTGAR